MKFKIDENLPVEAPLTLREHGFEADTVSDKALSGADDEAIAAVEKRSPEGELWIVQNDRIRFREGSQSSG